MSDCVCYVCDLHDGEEAALRENEQVSIEELEASYERLFSAAHAFATDGTAEAWDELESAVAQRAWARSRLTMPATDNAKAATAARAQTARAIAARADVHMRLPEVSDSDRMRLLATQLAATQEEAQRLHGRIVEQHERHLEKVAKLEAKVSELTEVRDAQFAALQTLARKLECSVSDLIVKPVGSVSAFEGKLVVAERERCAKVAAAFDPGEDIDSDIAACIAEAIRGLKP